MEVMWRVGEHFLRPAAEFELLHVQPFAEGDDDGVDRHAIDIVNSVGTPRRKALRGREQVDVDVDGRDPRLRAMLPPLVLLLVRDAQRLRRLASAIDVQDVGVVVDVAAGGDERERADRQDRERRFRRTESLPQFEPYG